MRAEIITIGDELLMGQTIDTNSAWIGQQFLELGISIAKKTAVSDQDTEILSALAAAQQQSTIVIITGGLGPTKDDITKKTLCTYFNCGLKQDPEVVAHLERMFAERGRKLLALNLMQADLPEIGTTLMNEVGTAPGMWLENEKGIIISLPGVPNEVYHLIDKQVIPRLIKRFKLKKRLHKTLITLQIPESLLSNKLESFEQSLPANIGLAYLPSFNLVKLRLTAKNGDVTESEFESQFQKLVKELGDDVFCLGDQEPTQFIAQYLLKNNISFSTAESCTGGYVAHRLMQVSGISAVFPGSVIAYDNEIKVRELEVPRAIIEEHGAVSEPCAGMMAAGIRSKMQVQLGISTTGIAGPTGGTAEKPVGLVYVGVDFNGNSLVTQLRLFGSREQIIQRTCNAVCWILKRHLSIPVE